MKTYTISIEVEIKASSQEAAYLVADYALDAGGLQEDITFRGAEVLAARVVKAHRLPTMPPPAVSPTPLASLGGPER